MSKRKKKKYRKMKRELKNPKPSSLVPAIILFFAALIGLAVGQYSSLLSNFVKPDIKPGISDKLSQPKRTVKKVGESLEERIGIYRGILEKPNLKKQMYYLIDKLYNAGQGLVGGQVYIKDDLMVFLDFRNHAYDLFGQYIEKLDPPTISTEELDHLITGIEAYTQVLSEEDFEGNDYVESLIEASGPLIKTLKFFRDRPEDLQYFYNNISEFRELHGNFAQVLMDIYVNSQFVNANIDQTIDENITGFSFIGDFVLSDTGLPPTESMQAATKEEGIPKFVLADMLNYKIDVYYVEQGKSHFLGRYDVAQ